MAFEWFAFSVVAGIGLLCLGLNRARWWVWVLSVAVIGLSVRAAYNWQSAFSRKAEASAEFAKKQPEPERPGGYVTSDQCASCHPDQFASWHSSYHRTMTQYPGPESVLGDFNNVDLEIDGEKIVLQRRGEEFWVELVDPEWKQHQFKAEAGVPGFKLQDPARARRVWKRISLVTGSHHFQAYWVSGDRGNLQHSIPITWLIQEKRWVGRKDAFIRDPERASPMQVWNLNCIQCHSTAGQPGENKYHLIESKVGEIGIACEACHGPAEKHVAANQNPLRRYSQHLGDSPEDTIIDPQKLSSKRATEVCGQCHSMRWTLDRQDWLQNGHAYRPGDQLEKTLPAIRPVKFDEQTFLPEEIRTNKMMLENIFWPDGMIRVTGREYNGLLETACFQRGDLSCLSCHSMHQSDPDDQLAKGMRGNQACLQCHETFAKNLEAHTRHASDSSGSLCYNCHMPFATYGLLKAVRNHFIDSPTVRATVDAGRPNACNLCHLDQTLEWASNRLHEWYDLPKADLHGDQARLSATVLMTLRGNAAQRALMAAAMGREEAIKASGKSWMTPLLLELMNDPYSAVRHIAARSLATHGQPARFDFTWPESQRKSALAELMQAWQRSTPDRTGTHLLIGDDGQWNTAEQARLLSERDQRVLNLVE